MIVKFIKRKKKNLKAGEGEDDPQILVDQMIYGPKMS